MHQPTLTHDSNETSRQIRGHSSLLPNVQGRTDSIGNTSKSKAELITSLTNEIRVHEIAPNKTTSELTEAYVHALQSLRRCRRDLDDLIPFLCRANFVYRNDATALTGDTENDVMEGKLDEMIARTRFDVRPPDNVIDASLLAQPPQRVAHALNRSLHSNVCRFVHDVFDSLDVLVDEQIAGLVEWTAQNACKYHFFRQVIVQKVHETTRTIGARRPAEESPTGWLEAVTTQQTGTHTYRLARHEHHTIDAFHTSIDDSEVVMPQRVRELVDRIPKWLAPITRVIDGKLAREIVVERDLSVEGWTQQHVRDVPVFGAEPALIIDHVVLTGWGPRDIDEELSRRNKEVTEVNLARERSRARNAAKYLARIGALISGFSLWAMIQFDSVWVGLALLTLCVPCWNAACGFWARATAQPLSINDSVKFTLSLVATVAGVGLSFHNLEVNILLVGASCALLILAIIGICKSRISLPSILGL